MWLWIVNSSGLASCKLEVRCCAPQISGISRWRGAIPVLCEARPPAQTLLAVFCCAWDQKTQICVIQRMDPGWFCNCTSIFWPQFRWQLKDYLTKHFAAQQNFQTTFVNVVPRWFPSIIKQMYSVTSLAPQALKVNFCNITHHNPKPTSSCKPPTTIVWQRINGNSTLSNGYYYCPQNWVRLTLWLTLAS